MKKFILIKADTNDADYITSKNEITDDQIELIKPVIQAIKDFKPYSTKTIRWSDWTHDNNYPNGECCRKDLGEKSAEELYGHLKGFELFNDLIPGDEYGINTIEEIVIIH